ncbi:MAG: hypothetical protein ACK5SX_09875 [Sandaracinobacter sp.]
MKPFVAIVAAAVLLQIADMASTEYMLRFSESGEEINELAATMQRSGSIWAVRLFTICMTVSILYLSRISKEELETLKEASIGQIMSGQYRGSTFWLNVKVSMLIFVFSISLSRGIAAVSNIMGEIAGLSIPIMVQTIWPNSNIYLVSITLSVSISLILITILWNTLKHKI